MKKIVIAVVSVFLSFSYAYAGNLYRGKLSNGLNFRIYKTNDLPIISVDIKIKAGSYFDKKFGEANVLANSLDSCATSHLTADEFRDMVDALGGRISSSASKQYIDITAKFPLSKADRMFCLLSEMFKSKFDKKNFDFVKREAVNEIKSLQNNKDYLAIHAAFVNLLAQNAYSHTSLGTIKGIRSITRKDIKTFFKQYFNTNNMVISVSGGKFNEKDIADMIKSHFSFLKIGKRALLAPVVFKKGLFVRDVIRKQAKQSYIYMAFPAFSSLDKRHYAAKILAFILGGNLDSVLAKDIRTKHGYAYSVFAFNYQMKKGGIFVIGLETQNIFTTYAVKRVFEDVKNIDNFITPDRIEDAKRYLIGRNEIALQSSLSVADALSSSYMLNIKELPWLSFRKEISKINRDDVVQAARKIFKSVSIGIVSSKNYEKEIKQMAREYGY